MEKTGKKIIVFASLILVSVAICLFCIVFYVNPFRSTEHLQILDSEQVDGGGAIILTQQYNASLGEPSTIAVFQQIDADQLIQYYISHESTYWWSGELRKIDGKIRVYRGSKLLHEIDPQKHEIRDLGNSNLLRQAFRPNNDPIVLTQLKTEALKVKGAK